MTTVVVASFEHGKAFSDEIVREMRGDVVHTTRAVVIEGQPTDASSWLFNDADLHGAAVLLIERLSDKP